MTSRGKTAGEPRVSSMAGKVKETRQAPRFLASGPEEVFCVAMALSGRTSIVVRPFDKFGKGINMSMARLGRCSLLVASI